jgi:hypothetical protein
MLHVPQDAPVTVLPDGGDDVAFACKLRLIIYQQSYTDWLIDYGQRYRRCRPISTSGAESAVEYVVDQRMKHKGHMRWRR